MKRCEWSSWTDGETVKRRAGGRRRYNAMRQRRAWRRRAAIDKWLCDHPWAGFFPRGLPAALAPAFGVHPTTIWRDLHLARPTADSLPAAWLRLLPQGGTGLYGLPRLPRRAGRGRSRRRRQGDSRPRPPTDNQEPAALPRPQEVVTQLTPPRGAPPGPAGPAGPPGRPAPDWQEAPWAGIYWRNPFQPARRRPGTSFSKTRPGDRLFPRQRPSGARNRRKKRASPRHRLQTVLTGTRGCGSLGRALSLRTLTKGLAGAEYRLRTWRG